MMSLQSSALLGSSRAWSGSASCCLGLPDREASLARSASIDACPLALPAPCVSGLLSGRVKLEASFWPSFFLVSLNLSTDVLSDSRASSLVQELHNRSCGDSKKKVRTEHWRKRKHRGTTNRLLHTSQPVRGKSR